MMTERQKTGWLYLALVLAVAAFIAFCVPRSQAQIVPIDASRIYVDGSTTSYANYLDTVTGELTIYSTASPAGTTLADLDPTAALAAFTGSANIVTLGTIATGVWSGTALVADKVPAHDALTGFVADEHIDWTAGPLDVGIVLNRETDAFSGVTFNDFAAPFATIGLSADANDDLEIKALLGSDIFILNSDSDGITITDTGTDPTITFDLGVAAEGIVFGGDTFGPTITCAGAGPQIILSDAAGASGFVVADSTTPTPVAQFDVNSDGRTGISGPHNDDAGIYFNSLGTITKGIDLSASGLSGATDYLVYFGATDYWSASGVVMVSDVSFAAAFGKTGDTNTRVTFPAADALGLSCGAVEIARAVEDTVSGFYVNYGSLDIDFAVYSDTLTAISVSGETGATTIGGTLGVTGDVTLGSDGVADKSITLYSATAGDSAQIYHSTDDFLIETTDQALRLKTSDAKAITLETGGAVSVLDLDDSSVALLVLDTTARTLALGAAGDAVATTVNGALTVTGDTVIATETPASAGADGTAGQIAWDADYIYICTATNTWERAAIATWP